MTAVTSLFVDCDVTGGRFPPPAVLSDHVVSLAGVTSWCHRVSPARQRLRTGQRCQAPGTGGRPEGPDLNARLQCWNWARLVTK